LLDAKPESESDAEDFLLARFLVDPESESESESDPDGFLRLDDADFEEELFELRLRWRTRSGSR
jgi:hypothetical protein